MTEEERARAFDAAVLTRDLAAYAMVGVARAIINHFDNYSRADIYESLSKEAEKYKNAHAEVERLSSVPLQPRLVTTHVRNAK